MADHKTTNPPPKTSDITRPPQSLVDSLKEIGSATASAEIKQLGLGLWLRGATPNFHTQTNIYPFAVNVPIACGGVLVMPGDIIIADDDGAVVVPVQLAPELARKATEHVEWEEFSRLKL